MNKNFDFVGIAGDWHGNFGWARLALKNFQLAGVTELISVGDFGFWPGNRGEKFLRKINKYLALYGITLYVTLGNHEDYVQVSTFQPHPTMDGYVYNPEFPNILVATRGARWTWNGVSFVSLGGANSIDFTGRVEWLTWWKAERISLADIYNTIEGGHAEIMISHDCPVGVNIFGSHRDGGKNSLWSPTELAYAQESRVALRQAVDGVKPEILFHGHYHMELDITTQMNDGVEDYSLRSVGLDMDASIRNMGILTLPDKGFEWLPLTWAAREEVMQGK